MQIMQKRVVLEYFSMMRLRAAWASRVMASASSRMMILVLNSALGKCTWVSAKVLMISRTTSMPRASLALSSRTIML